MTGKSLLSPADTVTGGGWFDLLHRLAERDTTTPTHHQAKLTDDESTEEESGKKKKKKDKDKEKKKKDKDKEKKEKKEKKRNKEEKEEKKEKKEKKRNKEEKEEKNEQENGVSGMYLEEARSRGESLLEREAMAFEAKIGRESPADAAWLKKVRSSGTTRDKLAAATLVRHPSHKYMRKTIIIIVVVVVVVMMMMTENGIGS